MPTLPLVQVGTTGVSPLRVVYACARPSSQSITAFAASVSFVPPEVGQPSE